MCVREAKSVSQLPICASRCASLSCSLRRVASACSSAARTTERSRSTAAISTWAIDSTKARSSAENAAARRLHATSSPNAAASEPIGAATRLTIPTAAEPGRAEGGLGAKVGAEQRLPPCRMRSIERRRSREGSGGWGATSPALARTVMPPSAVVSSTMIMSLASVSWSTRAASSNSSATGRPREGERAERADVRLLGEAVARVVASDARAR